MKFILIIITMLVGISFQALAQVKVVDGDSLEIDGKKIRLVGIDSPEYFQICRTKDDKPYNCGQKALQHMEQMVDRGHAHGEKVVCEKISVDRYHRALSLCRIGDVNLNYEMVKSGWAVAYRDEMFKEAELSAKNQGLGIWQGRFMRPELHRILKKYRPEAVDELPHENFYFKKN